MEQVFHHVVRREETIRCSIALEPRSTAATHSCAVLFCAAFLGSTHGEDGKEVKLPCWDENSATYAYGAWDKHCKSKHYKFVHEPLMTTFKDVEFEAKEFCADAPLECGLGSVHLIEVMSSISVYAISNQLAQARLSITSTGDAAPLDVPRGRSSQNSAVMVGPNGVKETDIAYKGQFQTLLNKHSDTSSVFNDSVNQDKFISMVAPFRMLIESESISGTASQPPFRRLCKIAMNEKIKLPHDIAEHIKAQAALASIKQPKPKVPVPRKPKGGSGSKAPTGLVDDDSVDDDEDSDDEVREVVPRKRSRLGNEEPADKGMEFFKKRIATLEAQHAVLLSQNQELLSQNSKLISDQGTGGTSKQPDGTDLDAEVAKLKVFDEQTMVVMSLLGACVDNLTAQDTAQDSAGKKMTNVMMNLIIAQMENIYEWPAHRKRCIYMTMKTQEAFTEALAKLNAEEPPEPKKKK